MHLSTVLDRVAPDIFVTQELGHDAAEEIGAALSVSRSETERRCTWAWNSAASLRTSARSLFPGGPAFGSK